MHPKTALISRRHGSGLSPTAGAITDQAAKDIVRKLLKINKSKRLGKAAGGAGSVMKHKWYSGFDWEGLLKRQLEVPIEPQVCL